jgi:hypothetical protein
MNAALQLFHAKNEARVQRATRAFLVQHFDANETALLERELTFKRAKMQEVIFASVEAAKFIPIASDIPPEAKTYSWNVLNKTGRAKVIANGSDDLPRVDVSGIERTGRVVTIGASYGWDVAELAEAARIGFLLENKKQEAAESAIAVEIDNTLATGDTTDETNLPFTGLINNPDVEAQGIINPDGDPWSGATTAANIFSSLNNMVSEVVNDLGNVTDLYPDTMLLPTREFLVAAQTRVGVDNDTTVLTSFLKNNPFIKNIAPWHKLTGKGVGGASRGIIYRRDDKVIEGIVPYWFTSLPPQARNLEMVVPCKGRAGGVKVYHPAAVRYADFAQV